MSQIIRDITEIARCGAQYKADRLAPLGLKGCHASYLMEICAHTGISQDQLAKRICINKSNVARQAATLEEEGFLTRIPSPTDKRIMELHPTEKTLELLPEISTVLKGWEALITDGVTAEELDQLAALVAKMKAHASDYMDQR